VTAFDRDDLIELLQELVARLEGAGEKARILIVGGAALSLVDYDRRLTVDVDAQIIPSEQVIAMAEQIAAERNITSDWLNDSVSTAFIPRFGKDPEWLEVYKSAAIEIAVAPLDLLLVMKLSAARRGRDDTDIAFLVAQLGITSVDEAEDLFDAYWPGEAIPERGIRMLQAILAGALEVPPPRHDDTARHDGWSFGR
jgi:hypothetical protein